MELIEKFINSTTLIIYLLIIILLALVLINLKINFIYTYIKRFIYIGSNVSAVLPADGLPLNINISTKT